MSANNSLISVLFDEYNLLSSVSATDNSTEVSDILYIHTIHFSYPFHNIYFLTIIGSNSTLNRPFLQDVKAINIIALLIMFALIC